MLAHLSKLVDDYDRKRISRRQLMAGLTGLVAVAGARSADAASGDGVTYTGTDLNHLALRVTDIPRSRDFYKKHLGLEVTSESASSCFMRCSEHDFLALFKSEKPGMDHYCFSIEDYDVAAVVERLKSVGLAPRRRGNRVYFDDPDGIEVQLAAKTHGV
jgi:catechol 2,3-dioxygenase-like lactoylglutathione lyase family enzyme